MLRWPRGRGADGASLAGNLPSESIKGMLGSSLGTVLLVFLQLSSAQDRFSSADSPETSSSLLALQIGTHEPASIWLVLKSAILPASR